MQIRQTVLSESISVSYLSWTNNLKADYLLHKNKRTARGNKKKFLFPYLEAPCWDCPVLLVALWLDVLPLSLTPVPVLCLLVGWGHEVMGMDSSTSTGLMLNALISPETDRPESARKSRMRHHIGPHVVVSSGSLQRIYLHCTNLF